MLRNTALGDAYLRSRLTPEDCRPCSDHEDNGKLKGCGIDHWSCAWIGEGYPRACLHERTLYRSEEQAALLIACQTNDDHTQPAVFPHRSTGNDQRTMFLILWA